MGSSPEARAHGSDPGVTGCLPGMTYNFDAERWYENQLRLLDRRFEAGELDEARHGVLVVELEHRYEAMLDRLDGTFSIPEE